MIQWSRLNRRIFIYVGAAAIIIVAFTVFMFLMQQLGLISKKTVTIGNLSGFKISGGMSGMFGDIYNLIDWSESGDLAVPPPREPREAPPVTGNTNESAPQRGGGSSSTRPAPATFEPLETPSVEREERAPATPRPSATPRPRSAIAPVASTPRPDLQKANNETQPWTPAKRTQKPGDDGWTPTGGGGGGPTSGGWTPTGSATPTPTPRPTVAGTHNYEIRVRDDIEIEENFITLKCDTSRKFHLVTYDADGQVKKYTNAAVTSITIPIGGHARVSCVDYQLEDWLKKENWNELANVTPLGTEEEDQALAYIEIAAGQSWGFRNNNTQKGVSIPYAKIANFMAVYMTRDKSGSERITSYFVKTTGAVRINPGSVTKITTINDTLKLYLPRTWVGTEIEEWSLGSTPVVLTFPAAGDPELFRGGGDESLVIENKFPYQLLLSHENQFGGRYDAVYSGYYEYRGNPYFGLSTYAKNTLGAIKVLPRKAEDNSSVGTTVISQTAASLSGAKSTIKIYYPADWSGQLTFERKLGGKALYTKDFEAGEIYEIACNSPDEGERRLPYAGASKFYSAQYLPQSYSEGDTPPNPVRGVTQIRVLSGGKTRIQPETTMTIYIPYEISEKYNISYVGEFYSSDDDTEPETGDDIPPS